MFQKYFDAQKFEKCFCYNERWVSLTYLHCGSSCAEPVQAATTPVHVSLEGQEICISVLCRFMLFCLKWTPINFIVKPHYIFCQDAVIWNSHSTHTVWCGELWPPCWLSADCLKMEQQLSYSMTKLNTSTSYAAYFWWLRWQPLSVWQSCSEKKYLRGLKLVWNKPQFILSAFSWPKKKKLSVVICFIPSYVFLNWHCSWSSSTCISMEMGHCSNIVGCHSASI